LVAEQPDITLAELKALLAKEKVTVGQSSISRFLRHLNLRLKKSLRAAEQDRPDVAAGRKALQKQQPRLDLKRLVFIDETSVSTTITRLYGRAPQGERLIQKVRHGNWKTITFVAALRHDRVTAPFVLEGPMNGEMFKAYRLSGPCCCDRGVGEAYRQARRRGHRRRPPALATRDQVKKKSAPARSNARPGFAAPLGAASRAREMGQSGQPRLDVH
jgi:arginine repressor